MMMCGILARITWGIGVLLCISTVLEASPHCSGFSDRCKCGNGPTLVDVFIPGCVLTQDGGRFCIPCPGSCTLYSKCETCHKTGCMTCPVGRSGTFCNVESTVKSHADSETKPTATDAENPLTSPSESPEQMVTKHSSGISNFKNLEHSAKLPKEVGSVEDLEHSEEQQKQRGSVIGNESDSNGLKTNDALREVLSKLSGDAVNKERSTQQTNKIGSINEILFKSFGFEKEETHNADQNVEFSGKVSAAKEIRTKVDDDFQSNDSNDSDEPNTTEVDRETATKEDFEENVYLVNTPVRKSQDDEKNTTREIYNEGQESEKLPIIAAKLVKKRQHHKDDDKIWKQKKTPLEQNWDINSRNENSEEYPNQENTSRPVEENINKPSNTEYHVVKIKSNIDDLNKSPNNKKFLADILSTFMAAKQRKHGVKDNKEHKPQGANFERGLIEQRIQDHSANPYGNVVMSFTSVRSNPFQHMNNPQEQWNHAGAPLFFNNPFNPFPDFFQFPFQQAMQFDQSGTNYVPSFRNQIYHPGSPPRYSYDGGYHHGMIHKTPRHYESDPVHGSRFAYSETYRQNDGPKRQYNRPSPFQDSNTKLVPESRETKWRQLPTLDDERESSAKCASGEACMNGEDIQHFADINSVGEKTKKGGSDPKGGKTNANADGPMPIKVVKFQNDQNDTITLRKEMSTPEGETRTRRSSGYDLNRFEEDMDESWCPVLKGVLHGNLDCVVFSFAKECTLKCHTGYSLATSTLPLHTCSRKRGNWAPSLSPCAGKYHQGNRPHMHGHGQSPNRHPSIQFRKLPASGQFSHTFHSVPPIEGLGPDFLYNTPGPVLYLHNSMPVLSSELHQFPERSQPNRFSGRSLPSQSSVRYQPDSSLERSLLLPEQPGDGSSPAKSQPDQFLETYRHGLSSETSQLKQFPERFPPGPLPELFNDGPPPENYQPDWLPKSPPLNDLTGDKSQPEHFPISYQLDPFPVRYQPETFSEKSQSGQLPEASRFDSNPERSQSDIFDEQSQLGQIQEASRYDSNPESFPPGSSPKLSKTGPSSEIYDQDRIPEIFQSGQISEKSHPDLFLERSQQGRHPENLQIGSSPDGSLPDQIPHINNPGKQIQQQSGFPKGVKDFDKDEYEAGNDRRAEDEYAEYDPSIRKDGNHGNEDANGDQKPNSVFQEKAKNKVDDGAEFYKDFENAKKRQRIRDAQDDSPADDKDYLKDNLEDNLKNNLKDNLKNNLKDNLKNNLKDNLKNNLEDNLKNNLKGQETDHQDQSSHQATDSDNDIEMPPAAK